MNNNKLGQFMFQQISRLIDEGRGGAIGSLAPRAFLKLRRLLHLFDLFDINNINK